MAQRLILNCEVDSSIPCGEVPVILTLRIPALLNLSFFSTSEKFNGLIFDIIDEESDLVGEIY